MKEKTKLVLIALSDENQNYYMDLLANYQNLSTETYSTLCQFKQNCQRKSYSGLIVDIRTLIKSTASDKDFYSSLYKGFPILQVDRGVDNTQINCFIEGEKSTDIKGIALFDHFIKNICQKRTPRGVRLKNRKKIFLNTSLYLSEKDSPMKTNLWDISDGGCFILSNHDIVNGDLVWISINELQDKTPICSQIKWKMPWGKNVKKLPGIGVSFLELTNKQKKEITSLSKN